MGLSVAVKSDRIWFRNHPNALIRFRRARRGEFAHLERNGQAPPFFVPSALRGKAPLTWVAVVDLTRILRGEREDPNLSLRVRFLTVPLRSRSLQRAWAPLYLKAVLSDLLCQMELCSDADDPQAA